MSQVVSNHTISTMSRTKTCWTFNITRITSSWCSVLIESNFACRITKKIWRFEEKSLRTKLALWTIWTSITIWWTLITSSWCSVCKESYWTIWVTKIIISQEMRWETLSTDWSWIRTSLTTWSTNLTNLIVDSVTKLTRRITKSIRS